jgi:hypothetical protein
MLSLSSLAFILCSAIRRARALSCAALHCAPEKHRIIEQKMATNMAANMAASMCGPSTDSLHLPKTNRAQRHSDINEIIDITQCNGHWEQAIKLNGPGERENPRLKGPSDVTRLFRLRPFSKSTSLRGAVTFRPLHCQRSRPPSRDQRRTSPCAF